MLRHPYDNLEEFVTAKLFVGVIFEVSGSAANLLEIYSHKQLVDDLCGQVSFIDDSPSLAKVNEINHANGRVVTGPLAEQILFVNNGIIIQ